MLKKKVQFSLSDESREALEHFDEDVKALVDMVTDLAATSLEIKIMIEADALMQAIDQEEIEVEDLAAEDENGVGVQPFDEAVKIILEGAPATAWQGEDVHPVDTETRSSPFTRAPRQVQVNWLVEVMANGDWHGANMIAREYATDERHFRYMKGAVTGRLREMWEEGICERRDSHVKGAMFEYRLKTGAAGR